jgi:hypothetical protein
MMVYGVNIPVFESHKNQDSVDNIYDFESTSITLQLMHGHTVCQIRVIQNARNLKPTIRSNDARNRAIIAIFSAREKTQVSRTVMQYQERMGYVYFLL